MSLPAAPDALPLVRPSRGRRRLAREALHYPRTRIGLLLVTLVGMLAVLGPELRPHSPSAFVGMQYASASRTYPLGTDSLGRDVLSEVLSGGRTILLESILATALGVSLGVFVGMLLGYAAASKLSGFFLRLNDTVLALPQMILVLLVLTRIRPSLLSLTLLVAAFHVPLTARVTRAATLKVAQEDFVSAIEAMGSARLSILLTEILPNITAPIFVELGIRFAISTVTLASLGYLGFSSVALDWGRMVYENQGGITIQPWGVVAPVVVMGAFMIGISLLTDGFSRAAVRASTR
jgi:peptide/nickel transport system permease protein